MMTVLLLLAIAAGGAAVLGIIVEIAHMRRPLKCRGFHVSRK